MVVFGKGTCLQGDSGFNQYIYLCFWVAQLEFFSLVAQVYKQ